MPGRATLDAVVLLAFDLVAPAGHPIDCRRACLAAPGRHPTPAIGYPYFGVLFWKPLPMAKLSAISQKSILLNERCFRANLRSYDLPSQFRRLRRSAVAGRV
jgi:hypothetical protein